MDSEMGYCALQSDLFFIYLFTFFFGGGGGRFCSRHSLFFNTPSVKRNVNS